MSKSGLPPAAHLSSLVRAFITFKGCEEKFAAGVTPEQAKKLEAARAASPSAQLETEESREVLGRDAAQLFRLDAAKVCREGRRLDDEGRLVSPSAKGHGREVWAVGLDEQAFGRHCARNLAQVLGLLEGDVAGERDHEAEFERRLGQRRPAAEAVHDAARAGFLQLPP